MRAWKDEKQEPTLWFQQETFKDPNKLRVKGWKGMPFRWEPKGSHGSYTSNNQKSWKIYRYMKNKQEAPEQPMAERRNQSVLPMNTQDWSPLGWTGWISSQSKGLLQHHSSKASVLQRSAFFMAQLSHPYMTTGKTIALTRRTFVGKIISLLFNMLSRLVITFPRSKCLLIS